MEYRRKKHGQKYFSNKYLRNKKGNGISFTGKFFEPEKYTTDTLPKITEKMDKEIVKFLAEKTKITKEQLVDERYNFFSNGY